MDLPPGQCLWLEPSLIYASFTFIFFALEATILGVALQMVSGCAGAVLPVASLGVIPLAMHGITLISRLQWWTQPLWILLCLLPHAAVALQDPGNSASSARWPGGCRQRAGFDAR